MLPLIVLPLLSQKTQCHTHERQQQQPQQCVYKHYFSPREIRTQTVASGFPQVQNTANKGAHAPAFSAGGRPPAVAVGGELRQQHGFADFRPAADRQPVLPRGRTRRESSACSPSERVRILEHVKRQGTLETLS